MDLRDWPRHRRTPSSHSHLLPLLRAAQKWTCVTGPSTGAPPAPTATCCRFCVLGGHGTEEAI